MYVVPEKITEILNLSNILPYPYQRQLSTFNECAWLCREPLVEALNCFRAIRTNVPSLRLVLWGPMGTGKSITLLQILHYAHTQNMVVLHVPDGKNIYFIH